MTPRKNSRVASKAVEPAEIPAEPTKELTAAAPRVKLRDVKTGKVASYDAYRARELMTAAGAPTHTVAPANAEDDE